MTRLIWHYRRQTGADADARAFILARLRSHVSLPLYRNAYALLLNSIVTSALGLAYWALAARSYSTEDLGLNSAAISVMIFLSTLAQLNLTGALTRFVPGAREGTARLVAWSYLAALALGLVAGAIFILGLDRWAPQLHFLVVQPEISAWFIVATMLWGVFTLQDAVLTSLRQAVWVPASNAVYGLLKIVLLLLFAAPLASVGIFASWTLPVALAVVPVSLLIFRYLIPRHVAQSDTVGSSTEARTLLKFVAGDYLGSLLTAMSIRFLPLLIVSQAGPSANAYFYLAWTIAYAVYLGAMNMAASLTVEGSNDEPNLAAHGRRMLMQMARLLVPAVAIIMIGAPYILGILGSSYTEEASVLLRLLGLAAVPVAIKELYLSLLRVRCQPGRILLVEGVTCSLVLGLSWALVRDYGANGVGVAWLASNMVVALVISLTQLLPILGSATEARGVGAWPPSRRRSAAQLVRSLQQDCASCAGRQNHPDTTSPITRR